MKFWIIWNRSFNFSLLSINPHTRMHLSHLLRYFVSHLYQLILQTSPSAWVFLYSNSSDVDQSLHEVSFELCNHSDIRSISSEICLNMSHFNNTIRTNMHCHFTQFLFSYESKRSSCSSCLISRIGVCGHFYM